MPTFQTALDGNVNDTAFRAFRNSTTGTSTVSLAAGTPIVLETNTASNNGYHAMQALTSTSVVNNLYIGNCHASVGADKVGLVQCYGVDDDAVVATAGASVGAQLIPNIGTFVTVGASTAGNCGVQGGGSGVLTVLTAPTGATQAATDVFVRAL